MLIWGLAAVTAAAAELALAEDVENGEIQLLLK